MRNKNLQSGFTALIAIVVTSTLLIVSTAIVTISVKQADISSVGRESQYAFYAADTGIECALYWDVKNPAGFSAFSTSTGSQITCNNQTFVVGGSSQSSFSLNLTPDPYCATVNITKFYEGNEIRTEMESLGYNTCDSSNLRRVERAVRVTY